MLYVKRAPYLLAFVLAGCLSTSGEQSSSVSESPNKVPDHVPGCDSNGSSARHNPHCLNQNETFSTKADGQVRSVLKDAQGNVFLIGHTEGTLTSPTTRIGPHNTQLIGLTDVFVTKLNSNLEWQWTKLYGSKFREGVSTAILSGDGQILIVGDTGGDFETNPTCCGITRGYLLSLDLNGARNWSTYFGPGTEVTAPNGISQNPGTIAHDALIVGQSIYVTGSTLTSGSNAGNNGWRDGFVAQLNLLGSTLRTMDLASADSDECYDILTVNNSLRVSCRRSAITNNDYALDAYSFDSDLSGLVATVGASTSGPMPISVDRTSYSKRLYDQIVTDGFGNTYQITGSASLTLQITKRDSSSATLWTKNYDFSSESPQSNYLYIGGAQVSSTGELVLSFTKDYGTPALQGLTFANWILELDATGTQTRLFLW